MSARAALNVVYRVRLDWPGTDDFDEALAADPAEIERRAAADMLDRLRAAGGAVG